MNRVEWCEVCEEYYSESTVEIRKHIMNDHTLSERLDSLHAKGATPEDTAK